MARFLFVVPPFTGHINPTVAVGRALERAGHGVAWCGVPGVCEPLLPAGAEFISACDPVPADDYATLADRSRGLRGAKALRFLWQEVIVPVAQGMLDGVEAAVDRFEPDAMVVDQQALAGAVVARRRGLPWATSASTSAELVDPLASLPLVDAWVRDQMTRLVRDAGVDTDGGTDLRFSDQLVLAFTTELFIGVDAAFPEHFAFVGPALGDRPDHSPFDLDWFDPAVPHVLVSLGTVSADSGGRFFRAAAEALADRSLQAVFVAPPGVVDQVADNIIVAPRVPQLSLLEHLDAVVCHGGHNTVCETLDHGLPLVVAPIRDDQPIIADQVVRSGAGLRVKFGRVQSDALGASIDAVLTDPSFREAARRVRRSFRSAGGSEAAARHLESIAVQSPQEVSA